jgi:hypothetical protein
VTVTVDVCHECRSTNVSHPRLTFVNEYHDHPTPCGHERLKDTIYTITPLLNRSPSPAHFLSHSTAMANQHPPPNTNPGQHSSEQYPESLHSEGRTHTTTQRTPDYTLDHINLDDLISAALLKEREDRDREERHRRMIKMCKKCAEQGREMQVESGVGIHIVNCRACRSAEREDERRRKEKAETTRRARELGST